MSSEANAGPPAPRPSRRWGPRSRVALDSPPPVDAAAEESRQEDSNDDDKENNFSSAATQTSQRSSSSSNQIALRVAAFCAATRNTSQSSFWELKKRADDDEDEDAADTSTTTKLRLVECVIQASLRYDQKTPSSSSLLLEEHAVEILHSCRALVKEAATSTSVKNATTTADALYVALHGLRAVSGTAAVAVSGNNKHCDTLLRLCYHIAVTAADRATQQQQQAAVYCYYTLAAFEALGTALGGCRTDQLSLPRRNNNSSSSHAVVCFPVPQQTEATKGTSSRNNNNNSTSSIPEDQLLGMGIYSALAAARAVALHIKQKQQSSLLSENDEENEFGLDIVDKVRKDGGGGASWRIVLRSLALDIAVPWIRRAASTTATDPKNIASHCKKLQRLLWDVALNDCSSRSERLLMQGDAIRASLLLNDDDAGVGVMDKGHRSALMSHFESACAYAWKAAEAYKRTNQDRVGDGDCDDRTTDDDDDATLHSFHRKLGAALDGWAATLEQDIPPLSYTEYCAYRAWHLVGSSRLPANMQWYSCHHEQQQQQQPSPDQSFLALFVLTLQIRDGVKTGSIVDDKKRKDDRVSWAKHARDTVSHFRSTMDRVPSATRLRYYRFFSMVKLHRVVYEVVLSRGGDDFGAFPQNYTADDLITLASKILSECIGPLCLGLIADKRLEESQWVVIAEIFKQAISGSEAVRNYNGLLHQSEANPENEFSSDCIIEAFTRILTKSSATRPPSECVENAAKFLNVIGKKRLEREESTDALVPLLHSMKLLIHVAPSLSVDSLRELKISSRLAFLSTTYSSLDLNDESVIMTVLALVFDTVESSLSPFDGDTPVCMLEYFIGLTRDVIGSASSDEGKSATSQRSFLASALVRLLSQRNRSLFDPNANPLKKPSALPPGRAIDLLLDSLGNGACATVEASFEQFCGVAFNLGGIFQVMFTRNAIPHLQCMDYSVLLAEKSCVSADILVKLGQVLQRMDRTVSEERAASFSDYSHVGRLAESYLQKIDTEDDMSKRVTTAAVLVVASVSLIGFLTPLDFANLKTVAKHDEKHDERVQSYFSLAEKYAVKAVLALGEVSEGATDWDLTESAVRLSLDLYQFQLSHLRCRQDGSLKIDFESLGFVVEGVKEALSSSVNVATIAQHCLVQSLVRLRGFFSLEGEELQAVQVARWSVDVTQPDGGDPNSWFEAAVLSLMVKDSMVPVDPVDNPDKTTAVTVQSAEMESSACRLRLIAKCSKDATSIELTSSRLRDLLDAAEERISSSPSTVKKFLFLWLRTTVFLGLAECAEKSGDLERALQQLRDCFKECRKLLSRLGRSGKRTLTECPFWSRVALSSLPVRCLERQVECLQKTAVLYSRLGDHRKTMEYARLAVQTTQFETAERPGTIKSTFTDLIELSRLEPAQSCQEISSRRLLLRLKAQMSSLDAVVEAFNKDAGGLVLSSVRFPKSRDKLTVNRELEVISDLIEIFDMVNGFPALANVNEEWDLVPTLRERYDRYLLSPAVARLMESHDPKRQIALQIQYDILLRDAVLLISASQAHDCRLLDEAIEKLNAIVGASSCSTFCQAWSYYLLGSIALGKATTSGELVLLWEGSFLRSRIPAPIADARRFFGEALRLLGSSCDSLKRNTQRCLALVSGPGTPEDASDMASCLLINSSVGAATRKKVLRSMLGPEDGESTENEKLLAAIYCGIDYNPVDESTFDSAQCFLNELGKHAHSGWRFATAALCPTGELLLTSIEFIDNDGGAQDVVHRTACLFPEPEYPDDDDDDNNTKMNGLYEEIVEPLDSIIQRSQIQLSEEVDVSAIGDKSGKEGCKRKWWGNRKEVDSDLEDLLRSVQRRLLSSVDAQQVLLGVGDRNYSIKISCGNLASRFEAASGAEIDEAAGEPNPEGMKVTELRDELVDSGFEAAGLRKMRKAELVELVMEKRMQASFGAEARGQRSGTDADATEHFDNDCTFLVLDENLQRFPFEGLPCFEGRTICRLPSLPFALAKLIELETTKGESAGFDPRRTSYVLDPESNLGATRDRLLPLIQSLDRKHGSEWQSVVGEAPSSDFFENALLEENGMLLYFGHGGGQKFVSRRKIEELILPDTTQSHCRRRASSSVILMGCSSGRLDSVNTRDSTSHPKAPFYYEPEGVALSYLSAGATCVVGNLWDVTDHDTDRFSVTLLEKVFEGDDNHRKISIAQGVAEARSACKMRSIVGCAPVCYGLPVARIDP